MIDSRSVNFSQNAWYDACSAEVEQCINSICYRNACGGAGAAVLSGDGCFCADGSPCEESAIVGNASSASSALFALFGVLLAMLA